MKKKKSKEDRLHEKILLLEDKLKEEIKIDYKYLFSNLKNTKKPEFNKLHEIKLLHKEEYNKAIMDLYSEEKENVIMLAKRKLIKRLLLVLCVALIFHLIVKYVLVILSVLITYIFFTAMENPFIAILLTLNKISIFQNFYSEIFFIITTLLIFTLQIIKYKRGKSSYLKQKNKIDTLVKLIQKTKKELRVEKRIQKNKKAD